MSSNTDKQHQLHVDNGSGFVVRTQINDAFEAIAKNNTGPTSPVWGATVGGTAPTTPAINQFWADNSATPAVLRIYDGAAWQKVRSIEEYDNSPKSRGVYTHNGDYFKVVGTGALTVPTGTTAQRPTGADLATGQLRFNNQLSRLEIYDGTAWGETATASVADNSIQTVHIQDGAITPAKLSQDINKLDYRIWYGIGASAMNYRTINPYRYGPFSECPSGTPGGQTLYQTHQSWWSEVLSGEVKGSIGVGNRYISACMWSGPTPILTRSGDVFMSGLSSVGYGQAAAWFPHGSVQNTTASQNVRAVIRRERNVNRYLSGVAHTNANDSINTDTLNDLNYSEEPTAAVQRDLLYEGQQYLNTYPEPWSAGFAFTDEKIVEVAYNGFDWHFITNSGRLYYAGNDDNGGSGYGSLGAVETRAARPVKLWELDPNNPSVSIALSPAAYPRFTFITNSRISDGHTTNTSYYASNGGYGHRSYYALTVDGDLWTWGYNANGQLGNGSTTSSYKPLKISFPSALNVKITYVHSYGGAQASAFAIDDQGRLWVWGYNASGELGDGTQVDKATPVCLTTDSNNPLYNKPIVHVIGSGNASHEHGYGILHGHTYYLTGDGFVYSSGDNREYGKFTGVHSATASSKLLYPTLVTNTYQNGSSPTTGGTGINDYESNGSFPRKVIQLFVTGGRNSSVFAVTKVWANSVPEADGGNITQALNGPSKVFSWGNNTNGLLGRQTTTIPDASGLNDYTPAEIQFRDYGITSHQALSDVTYEELTGANIDPPLSAGQNTTKARFHFNVRSISGNVSMSGTQGTVVLVTGEGAVYYTGYDPGGMGPGIVPDGDVAIQKFGGGFGVSDLFTPIMSLPEPCMDWQWANSGDVHGGINYVYVGTSGMSYWTGETGTMSYIDNNYNNYVYMYPMTRYVNFG